MSLQGRMPAQARGKEAVGAGALRSIPTYEGFEPTTPWF